MDILKAALLGIVEGLTEFIPVSSTGHLLLLDHFTGIGDDDFGKTFAVLIQLGAILAILSVYAKKLIDIALRLPSDPGARRFVLGVLLAFLPAVNLGFTSLKIQPMAFGDLLFNRFPPTGEDGLIPAYGGGVDFRFSSPVGLSFLFGYKGSLVEGRRHGFLFEFKTDLY